MKNLEKFILVAVFAAISSGASAQESFKHLSVGLEVGTTGAGLQLALPVVTDHLVLTAGYNFPSIGWNSTMSIPTSDLRDGVDKFNSSLSSAGLSDRIQNRFGSSTDATVKANVNLGRAKMMLEYYPSKKSSFHITAGFYAGGADFISADLSSTQAFMSDVKATQSEIKALQQKYSDYEEVRSYNLESIEDLKISASGKSYQLKEKDGCAQISASIRTAKVLPYLGIGIGRSFPDGHFGVQGDLGVAYHGKPSLYSPNEVAYDSAAQVLSGLEDALEIVEKVCVYPQLSVRLVYKIF